MTRFHHSYRAGFWGLAFDIERGLEITDFKGDQWFFQVGRKVFVFRSANRKRGDSGEVTNE